MHNSVHFVNNAASFQAATTGTISYVAGANKLIVCATLQACFQDNCVWDWHTSYSSTLSRLFLSFLHLALKMYPTYRLPGLHCSRGMSFLFMQEVIPRWYWSGSFGLWSSENGKCKTENVKSVLKHYQEQTATCYCSIINLGCISILGHQPCWFYGCHFSQSFYYRVLTPFLKLVKFKYISSIFKVCFSAFPAPYSCGKLQ